MAQQFPGKLGFSAETMDDPPLQRLDFASQRYDFRETFHNVQYQRFPKTLAKLYVGPKHIQLPLNRPPFQTVNTRFADGDHLRALGISPKQLQIRDISASESIGVYSYRILFALDKFRSRLH